MIVKTANLTSPGMQIRCSLDGSLPCCPTSPVGSSLLSINVLQLTMIAREDAL